MKLKRVFKFIPDTFDALSKGSYLLFYFFIFLSAVGGFLYSNYWLIVWSYQSTEAKLGSFIAFLLTACATIFLFLPSTFFVFAGFLASLAESEKKEFQAKKNQPATNKSGIAKTS